MARVMEDVIRERMDSVIAEVVQRMPADRKPSRVVNVAPGQSVAWDECCAGQLTARLATMTPVFRQPRTAVMTPCSILYWAATVEVQLLRCAAVVNNQGMAPSPGQITLNGIDGLQDTRIILEAITAQDFVDGVPNWLPIGPNGGCYGVAWTFSMKLDSTPCE